MMLLPACLNPVRQVAAIAFPWRADGKATAIVLLRGSLHLLLGSALLAGLWYLNRWSGVERVLRSPWPMLHRTWLPLLGTLVYLLGWLSRGLWLALRRDSLPGVWPDLDDAWHEALTCLKQANLDVQTTPLFLILGPLTLDLGALLQAFGAAAVFREANRPFYVFAHRPAIFVVCDNLAQLGRSGADSDAREPNAERLNHLCELLARERAAKLPIQGIVLMVPFSTMQSTTDTRKVVAETQNDLRVVRQATGLEVPLYVAVSGMHLQIAAAQGEAAWFQRFPPLPDLDVAEVHLMFQEGVDRLCLEQLAGAVRAHFRLGEDGKPTEALRENIRLYQWLVAIHAWRVHLGRLLIEGTRNDYSEPGMEAGCYVLPSGTARSQHSALAQALGGDLLAYQHTACWTPETNAAHARRGRRTWLGYGAGLLGLCASVVAVAWFRHFRA